MMKEVYGKGSEMSEVHYWQFKELYEAAHGVAEKEVITKLVLSYLGFNEYGEVPKSEFFKMLETCLSAGGRSLRVMQGIFWGWLEAQELVVNNAIKKESLSLWYEPVKVVFLLLLSVMFGTEYASIEEMVEKMVKYEYY